MSVRIHRPFQNFIAYSPNSLLILLCILSILFIVPLHWPFSPLLPFSPKNNILKTVFYIAKFEKKNFLGNDLPQIIPLVIYAFCCILSNILINRMSFQKFVSVFFCFLQLKYNSVLQEPLNRKILAKLNKLCDVFSNPSSTI